MNYKPILIVAGEPNSIFLEIFLKTFKFKKFKSPIILISSLKLLKFYMKKFNIKNKKNIINKKSKSYENLSNNIINLININLKNIKDSSRVSNKFIDDSFKIGLELVRKKVSNKFINGPITKKNFS